MKNIFIFLGPPGSGKGTMADILGRELGIAVVSPGELLRKEKDKGSKLGQNVAALLDAGQLVGDDIVGKIIDKRLEEEDAFPGFIFDGYPRRLSQLDHLAKIIGSPNKHKVIAVYIDVDDNIILERISGRLVCDCGESYNIISNPPRKEGVCDKCGAKLYQRKDDAPEVVKERLKKFHKRIDGIIKYFEDNFTFIKINGEQEISKEWVELNNKLKKLI